MVNTLIVGASISGLACAACLHQHEIDYQLIEQHDQIATPWRNHYERLHLHTPKSGSSLPFKKFAHNIPRYPSRAAVVDYLEDYRKTFEIEPRFGTRALKIKHAAGAWITETSNGLYCSQRLIMATGPFSKPNPVSFPGLDTFPGPAMHSSQYKSAKAFKNQNVLVVGFGNSACEIAIDLYEQGARPTMAVRSPVNIVPREVLGIPIVQLSSLLGVLPPQMADSLSKPVIRWAIGNVKRLGLAQPPYGPLKQIQKDMRAPVLDIGTVKHIRKGHIKIEEDIDHIEGHTVYFKNKNHADFDAIIAAIGFYRDYAEFLEVDKTRFEDLNYPIHKQQHFGKDGLYFCGYWISPIGQIQEIASDAKKIAAHISSSRNLTS
jgi:indole-3-pyruvate monooxygenase